MKKAKIRSREQAREDELVALAKAMSPQERLEAAVRLSAIAFEFHQAGIAYREELRHKSGKTDVADKDGA